jgi:lipopolysaccharide transport system ATP-binding protein
LTPDGPAVEVRDLGKMYRIYRRPQDRLKQMLMARIGRQYGREFWALRHVSFDVGRGESIGIIGRNGSGKSTLLQIITGILTPTEGEVRVSGRVAALLELGSGFNPEFTGRENAVMNGVILGIPAREMESRLDEIAAFADIGQFFDQPVKLYSSGMFLRLAFAVATSLDADILVIDEALAVGDVFFQQKCYRRLEALRDSGVSVLLVSHTMADVEHFCRRALVLDAGAGAFVGPAAEGVRRYYLLDQAARAREPAPAPSAPPPAPPPEAPPAEWPPAGAFIDISEVPQVSSGGARCTGVAICDAHGRPCTAFAQGERASFFYEFELLKDIEVPIGGLMIYNQKAVLVYGKNTIQSEAEVPPVVHAGSRVRFRHDIDLRVAPEEYSFEVGLATMSRQHFEDRALSSDAALHAQIVRLCHLPTAGRFTVVFPAQAIRLGHYGVADLRSGCEVEVV